jgi:hypothetical protein
LLFRTPYAGRRLAVRLSATTVDVLDAGRIVARHERAADRYVEVLTLDHYLEVLKTKPGALPGATASRTAYTPSDIASARLRDDQVSDVLKSAAGLAVNTLTTSASFGPICSLLQLMLTDDCDVSSCC